MTSMIAAGTVLGSLSGGWMLELSGMTTMLAVNVIIALVGVGFALISVKNKRLLVNTQ
jgi:predicted MFS family arabinose efflux permease